jgi:hypothetical protein
VSGGGRRGEIRKRNARPHATVTGGEHNRKARRAAGAQKRPAPRQVDDTDRIAQRFARMRAEREAYWKTVTDADLLDMRLEQSERESEGLGGPWFLPMLVEAVPGWIERHAATPPEEREARAHALGDIIAYSQGAAALSDPDARGTEREGSVAEVFNAIAEGLAIGAFCPGGALFGGHLWQVEASRLRVQNRVYCWQATL